MTAAGPRILVIGAGIIGAAIAYHLARRGAAVTVIDRDEPTSGATSASFAWINASFGNPKPYYLLRVQAMQDFYRLDSELAGALGVNWSGCLTWDLTQAELQEYAHVHAAFKHDADAKTTLTPVSKSEALRDLVDQSMDLKLWGASGLDMLVRVVQRAECYVLCSNQLEGSVALVKELAS